MQLFRLPQPSLNIAKKTPEEQYHPIFPNIEAYQVTPKSAFPEVTGRRLPLPELQGPRKPPCLFAFTCPKHFSNSRFAWNCSTRRFISLTWLPLKCDTPGGVNSTFQLSVKMFIRFPYEEDCDWTEKPSVPLWESRKATKREKYFPKGRLGIQAPLACAVFSDCPWS